MSAMILDSSTLHRSYAIEVTNNPPDDGEALYAAYAGLLGIEEIVTPSAAEAILAERELLAESEAASRAYREIEAAEQAEAEKLWPSYAAYLS